MKVISGEFQHSLVVPDIDTKKISNVVRKTCAERQRITLLKDVKIRKKFKENVIKLVDVGAPNLWGRLEDGALKECDEVCGKKRGRKSRGDTWWWNKVVKEVISRKKYVHKAMSQNSTEENNRRY